MLLDSTAYAQDLTVTAEVNDTICLAAKNALISTTIDISLQVRIWHSKLTARGTVDVRARGARFDPSILRDLLDTL